MPIAQCRLRFTYRGLLIAWRKVPSTDCLLRYSATIALTAGLSHDHSLSAICSEAPIARNAARSTQGALCLSYGTIAEPLIVALKRKYRAWARYFLWPASPRQSGRSDRPMNNHMSYCSAISTSTPAGKSRRISASTVLSVGSTMSIRRWCVRISNWSRDVLFT